MSDTYSYSYNEEHYHGQHKTREEALVAGRAEHPGTTISTAKVVPFAPDYDAVANTVFETLSEQAFDQCGECAENWEIEGNAYGKDLKTELAMRMAESIKQLVDRHQPPVGFWTVTEIEYHEPHEVKE